MNLIKPYQACDQRYKTKNFYRRCGESGIKLPKVSLGLWHNFGKNDALQNQKKLIQTAFDNGITHFDLANNYGPPPGSAETNFGKILRDDLSAYRDELILSTKAGYGMWEGPYGDFGSRKYLIASCDQSLKRMGLDYVDIFYHHRPDPDTPLEETMSALDHLVKSGKALYIGISNYSETEALKAIRILEGLGTPCLIHQLRYNMLDAKPQEDVLPSLFQAGVGSIVYSPLAQGLLSNRYCNAIPKGSRAERKDSPFLNHHEVETHQSIIHNLTTLSEKRGQTLAQLALAWCLRLESVTSVLIGVSTTEQIKENLKACDHTDFTEEELDEITRICQKN